MKTIFKIFLLSISGCSAPMVQADSSSVVSAPMQSMLDSLWDLRPYMISYESFASPKKNKEVLDKLENFSKNAKHATQATANESIVFKAISQELDEHVRSTVLLYKWGNYKRSHEYLMATPFLCSSCHTADLLVPTETVKIEDTSTPLNDLNAARIFQNAELLFASRKYTEALNLYHNVLLNNFQSQTQDDIIDAGLRRLLAYHLKISRDPKAAINELVGFKMSSKKISSKIQKNIEAWLSMLSKTESLAQVDPNTLDEKDFKKLMTKLSKMKPLDKPAFALQISSLMLDYISKNPRSPFTQQILYWMAECDEAQNNTFATSLTDAYLKECILGQTGYKIALKCYRKYTSRVLNAFDVRKISELPPGLIEYLDKLKVRLEKIQKDFNSIKI